MKTILLYLVLLLSATLHYSQVTEDWVRTFEGNFGAVPFDMVIDNLGNVYITGTTGGEINTGEDYTTIKYSSSGDLQWEAKYNGTANANDEGYAIAVDQSGNVYVTGESFGTINGYDSGLDYLTIKYDSQGNEIWAERYNGNNSFINNTTDEPTDIAVDDNGNVYVTGTSAPDGGATQNCLTLRYDASGALQWEARYNQGVSIGVAVKVDAAGNVYVASSGPGLTAGIDYITIKYNSSSQELWVKRYNVTGNEFNHPTAMVIDDAGNVYVTGHSDYYGYLTVIYNTSGDLLWAATYPGFSSGNSAKDIVVDGLGNVFITGRSANATFTSAEYATIKYNSNGVEQWVASYAGAGGTMGSSGANAIALDDLGNIYVTGKTEVDFLQGNFYDYATIKYDSDGNEQWAVTYDGTGSDVDEAISIFVDQNEKVYITGRSMQPNGNEAFATIKYSQSPSSVNEISSETPDNYLLYQNYPNPFNPSTVIRWQSPVSSHQTLKVYDLLGNEVATLVNEFLPVGSFEVEWNAMKVPSGIYFYKLQAGSFVETKKMLLLK